MHANVLYEGYEKACVKIKVSFTPFVVLLVFSFILYVQNYSSTLFSLFTLLHKIENTYFSNSREKEPPAAIHLIYCQL